MIGAEAVRSRIAACGETVRWILRAETATSAVLQNLLTQFAFIAISFGTGIIIARNLGATGRGELTAMTIWPSFFSGIFAFGIPDALVYYARRFPKQEESLFSGAIVISACLSPAMLIAGIIVVPHLVRKYDPATIRLAIIVICLSPSLLIGSLTAAFFQLRGMYTLLNKTRYGPTLATLAILLGLILTHRLTPASAVWAYVIPPIPILLFSLYHISRTISIRFTHLRESIDMLVHYGARAAGISILGTLSGQVDQVLVVGFFSPATMGMYIVALSVARILHSLFAAVNVVVSPKLIGLSTKDLTKYVGQALRLSIFFGIIGALLIALATPFLLPLIYGREFSGAVPLVFAFLADVGISGLNGNLAEAFKARGRPGLVTTISAISLIMDAAFLLVLIPRLGVIGAPLSLVLVAALRFAAYMRLYPTVTGTAVPSLLIGPTDFEIIFRQFRLQSRGQTKR